MCGVRTVVLALVVAVVLSVPAWAQCELAKLTAAEAGGGLGTSVAIWQDVVAAGALNAEASWVFRDDGQDWVEEAELVASDSEVGDQFGIFVSVDRDLILVGAPGDDDDEGSAYIFWYDGKSWIQQAKLLALDGAPSDQFGRSVSLCGDIAAVGAPADDGWTGSVYIFRRTGQHWEPEAKLNALDAAAGDAFGQGLDSHGGTLVVGARWANDNGEGSGSAYVFRHYGSVWVQEAKLLPSDGDAGDRFGGSVAVFDDVVLVAAPWDEPFGVKSGSAYVFRFDGSSWVQEAKLLASDGAYYDVFGVSVGLYDGRAVVGAYFDDDLNDRA